MTNEELGHTLENRTEFLIAGGTDNLSITSKPNFTKYSLAVSVIKYISCYFFSLAYFLASEINVFAKN